MIFMWLIVLDFLHYDGIFKKKLLFHIICIEYSYTVIHNEVSTIILSVKILSLRQLRALTD